jgi:hypothetical protein
LISSQSSSAKRGAFGVGVEALACGASTFDNPRGLDNTIIARQR